MLCTNLVTAQDRMKSSANVNRVPAPAYRVGDMVLLSTKNITSTKRIPKFDSKYIGPYRISQIVNLHSYKLDLPCELKSIYLVFYTNLLRPAASTPLPGQHNLPPPPVLIAEDRQTFWAVERILDSRRKRGKFEYLIRWRGFDQSHDS